MISFLRDNLVWIVLSLLLSVALWVVVTFQVDPEDTRTVADVNVEIQGASQSYIVQVDPTAVQLIVSAPRDVWPQLGSRSFRAQVDASKATLGVQDLPLKLTSADPRARVEGATPDKVSLRVEQLSAKQVPVRVVQHGSVTFGYNLGTTTTTPSAITISGPQTNVDQVQAVAVEVNLDGLTKTLDQKAVPVPETASGTPVDRITLNPAAVLVQVPVEQKLDYKTVPVQADTQGTVALGYQLVGLMVQPQTVTLVGDPNTLGQMPVVKTQPISIQDVTSDREIPTTLVLPPTVALLQPQSGQPQSIVVRVLVSALPGTKTILISPQLANQAPNVGYEMTPGSVNVTISGAVPDLNRLQALDVPVVADVKGMTSGSQSVELLVGVPPQLKLVNVQPKSISIAVK